MKISQSQPMLGWILVLTVINSVMIIVTISSLGSLRAAVSNINGGSSDNDKLSNIQSSISDLSTKVSGSNPTTPVTSSTLSKETTCTGTLNMNLSGSLTSSYANLSSITPINLTCNPL
jgi:hypothetical protein